MIDVEEQLRINSHALLHFDDGGGPCKTGMLFRQALPIERLSFPFLFASFCRLDKYASKDTDWKHYSKYSSQNRWEFLEKMASELDSKDGFPNIGHGFGNKLAAPFVDNYFHDVNSSMEDWWCQGGSKAQSSKVKSQSYSSKLKSF